MPREAGHFCWVYFFLQVRKILNSARKYRSVARGRAQKSNSLNLNEAHQNFEAKKFLNPRRQSARLFAG